MVIKFLRSQNRQYALTNTSVESEGTTIAVSPNAQSLASTRVTVLFPPPMTPRGFRGAFLLPSIFGDVMGREFDAAEMATFFDKAGQELLRSDRYSERYGEIGITVTPDAGRWRVEIQPC